MLYVWYPKNRTDLNTIHEENDIIGMEELARVKAYLFNYEDGTPKSLYDSLRSLQDPASWSFITGLLQDCYKFPINFLSRDYRTPIKRLQDSYKFPMNLL